MGKVNEGSKTYDHYESNTVAGIPLNEEQLALFEKINMEARGIDFGPARKSPKRTCVTTIIEDVLEETITEEVVATEWDKKAPAKAFFMGFKSHIQDFEHTIGDDYEAMITPASFSKYSELRLVSVTVYESGALSMRCEAKGGKQISLFDHIDKISFALTRSPKLALAKKGRKVVFTLAAKPI